MWLRHRPLPETKYSGAFDTNHNCIYFFFLKVLSPKPIYLSQKEHTKFGCDDLASRDNSGQHIEVLFNPERAAAVDKQSQGICETLGRGLASGLQ